MEDFINKGGIPMEENDDSLKPETPLRRGVKQGALMIFSGFVVLPLLAILHEAIRFPEEIVGFAAVFLFMGGFWRIIYALIFQRKGSAGATNEGLFSSIKQTFLGKAQPQALPPQQSQPISTNFEQPPAGNWRETRDLEPVSSEKTTRL